MNVVNITFQYKKNIDGGIERQAVFNKKPDHYIEINGNEEYLFSMTMQRSTYSWRYDTDIRIYSKTGYLPWITETIKGSKVEKQ